MIKTYFSIVLAAAALDGIWFFTVAGNFFKKALGPILRMSGDKVAPVWASAAPIYFILAALVVFFALPRVNPASPVASSLLWGAFIGLCVYGVYDLTNYALLKDWKLSVLALDMFWGILSASLLTLAATYLSRWFA